MGFNDLTETDIFLLQEGLSDAIRRTQESMRWSYDHKDWNRHARREAALADLREAYAVLSDRWTRIYGGGS